MKKAWFFPMLVLLCVCLLAGSCRARDCKGRKKTAKTNMGGWL